MSANKTSLLAGGAIVLLSFLSACEPKATPVTAKIFQTSAAGDQLKEIQGSSAKEATQTLELFTDQPQQTINGFGGAFTESSAYLLNQLSPENRQKVIAAYFADEGAAYSLCRTHINSCDFSLNHYSYAPVAGDTALDSFSIHEDMDDIIPFIHEAQEASANGFKILASPWTAPPWMKDNKQWEGGKLLPEYYDAWARFFVRYHQEYAKEGIDIWGYTVENEPLGNDANWESMHYTPQETAEFVKAHLGPAFNAAGVETNILVYDQNRGEELEEWANVLLTDKELLPMIYGTAVHWYTSTVDWMAPSLKHTHELAPDKAIIHTEGCVDAEIPHWQDDAWYWTKEATDWGWDWAPEDQKVNHPKYVPAYRYARDIIGCLNNHVEGWIDWNMVLDRQGGPNHASNWCVAPVIVDPEKDEVYFTPLYYIMTHFSRFIRPEAKVINTSSLPEGMMATAAMNPDGSLAVCLLNMTSEAQSIELKSTLGSLVVDIDGQALQTIVMEASRTHE